jgi:hypothetical protein
MIGEENTALKKSYSSFRALLSKNGYSKNAIDEISKWYCRSTTKN